MARTYHRDSRGRFASGGGGGGGSGGRKAARLPAPVRRTVGSAPPKRRGLLLQRGAVASSKRKLAGMDPGDKSIKGTLSRRSQKGAVTRAQRQLQAAQQGGRVRLSGRAGVLRPGKKSAKSVQPRQVGWMQSTEARADRVHDAVDRKRYANVLKAMPKIARRAIAVETIGRRMRRDRIGDPAMDQHIIAISEGRIRLAYSYRKRSKRRGALSPGEVQSIARSMASSADRLRALQRRS